MILQRDKRCLPEIQEFGCYYMDLLYLANKYTNVPLGFPFINDYYERCQERLWIKDNLIQDPAAILYHLGFQTIYLGHINAEYLCKPDEIEILHFTRETKDKTIHHFVCGDGKNHVTYDPYGISLTVRKGELHNKRVFKRIML